MDVRNAEEAEIGHLAKIWYDGWQDAHAKILPPELARLRTLESFVVVLRNGLSNVRVTGAVRAPVAFCMVKGEQLYQLFDDAEARLVENGVETAWLSCAIGNERAARFYEKCGWRRVGTVVDILETTEGTFPLEIWRYEKSLTRSGT